MPKNKITTQGYFVKRLRDAGYYVVRLYSRYSKDDPRKWTVILNPKRESLLITCYDGSDFEGIALYEFNDGGVNLPRNFNISTDSIEVVLGHLKQFGVIGREPLNINDGRRKAQKTSKETEEKN